MRTSRLRLGQLSLAGITLALIVAACNDDPIVYPNRNLRAPGGGETSEGGAAGETGAETGGMPGGGSGAVGGSIPKAGSGGMSVGGDEADGGAAGAAMAGPVCGNGVVEPPEQCDDGNTVSGDGCSSDCKSSCEKCEKNVCPIYNAVTDTDEQAYEGCYQAMGIIAKGPAMGVERAEVCGQLVDCIRQENCAQTKAGVLIPKSCWCDQDWVPPASPAVQCKTTADPNNPTDPTKFIPGKCASIFQDASEYPTLSDVEAQFNALNQAEGKALRLIESCDARVCTEECVPNYLGHEAVATISADILVAPNAAGESAMGDLIADSQRDLANTDFALVSPGFIDTDAQEDLLFAPTANRDADAAGRVLWSEALAVSFGHGGNTPNGYSVNPQANLSLYKVNFTGQQIYDALTKQFTPGAGGILFVSGLTYGYTADPANPANSIVNEVHKASDGTPIDKSAIYTVALTEYLTNASSPISVLTKGTNPTLVPGVPISEQLGEYLKKLPQPISPPQLNRVTRTN